MIRNSWKIFSAILLFTGSVAHGAAFQFGGLRLDALRVTSGATTTTLTKSDYQVRTITGSANDTQKLTDATTLQAGYWYWFLSSTSGTVTIQDNSGSSLTTLSNGDSAFIVLSSAATSAGTWNVYKAVGSASGGSYGSLTVHTCAASCTALTTDDIMYITSSATVTLPAATSTRPLYINSNATTVDVIPAGSDTIIFDTLMRIWGVGASALLITNGGTTWFVH